MSSLVSMISSDAKDGGRSTRALNSGAECDDEKIELGFSVNLIFILSIINLSARVTRIITSKTD